MSKICVGFGMNSELHSGYSRCTIPVLLKEGINGNPGGLAMYIVSNIHSTYTLDTI